MSYSFKREKVETNYLRPRYKEFDDRGVEHNYKGLINVSDNPGRICWGIVDSDDKFLGYNMQMLLSPWTGEELPQTIEDLKLLIKQQ